MTMKPLCPVYFVESSLFGAAVHLTSAHDKYSALHVTTTIPEQTPRSWSVVDIMPPFSRLTDTKFLAQVHKKVLGQRAEEIEWRNAYFAYPKSARSGLRYGHGRCYNSVLYLLGIGIDGPEHQFSVWNHY